jgi:hypothetical protein
MKKLVNYSGLLITLIVVISVNVTQAQIMITSGEDVTPEELVAHLVGEGVQFSNVQYQGADHAIGMFTNGYSTNLGIGSGIILTSGSALAIQGPNYNAGATTSNGMPGDPTLTGLAGQSTYDAAVLQFDVVVEFDTIYLKYVFGSEEYPEYVLDLHNDVFGFFISGPNPDGGSYSNKNIAIVPGSDPESAVSVKSINNVVPSFEWLYVDNTGGLTIEYDGFTTALYAWLKIVPFETYHIKLAIADAGDQIIDSGVCLEENSLFAPFYAECYSFRFDTTYNAGLQYPAVGEIVNDSIFVEVPASTNLTALVASYILSPGAIAFVDEVYQQSGVNANDFTAPVTYHVYSQYNNEKDWVVIVNMAVGVNEANVDNVSVFPNPAKETVYINKADGFDLSIVNTQGLTILRKQIKSNQYSIDVSQFDAGVYFLKFENEQNQFARKVVIEK